ncbi:hypothetical protein GQ44DRAFT_797222 [Phaeosphaeriaceae sp. PMI808]|nr:hypothetical protein GQ44DRAFT_797222 [Phaeosphaeriaceae sp. PMI808]
MTKLRSSADIATMEASHKTLGNFNSGTFLYRPSPELSSFVQSKFKTLGNKKLRAMKFPDQDFLNTAFEGQWSALSWKTNALKMWRYWHTNIWNDDQVAVLHYIVDKPWAKRGNPDGLAGYLGKDGDIHMWWWDEYDGWVKERADQGEKELLCTVGKYVASKTGEESGEMRAISGGAQDYAKKWNGNKDGEDRC